MNVKTTVVLLVLVVICIGCFLILRSDWLGKQAPPTQPAEPSKKLTPDVGKVVRLVLQRPRVSKVVLVAEGDKWRLTEPVEAPATGWEVSSTVTTLTNLAYLRKYAPGDPDCPQDNLTYLSDPLRLATFTDDKGNSYTLKVGGKPPLSDRQTYVQLEGDEHVYVVDADLAESLNKTPADYRQKTVAELDTDKAVRLALRGEQRYQLVKLGEKWAVDQPVAARADQEKVKSLLRDISALQAEKFVDDDPKDLAGYGLDKPRLEVTVELAPPEPKQPATTQATRPAPPQKGRVITLAFGAAADKTEGLVFAKLADRPWVFHVKQSKLKDIQPKLLDLRDKAVLDIGDREVTRVEITYAEAASAVLEKINNDWHMRNPFAGPCDEQAVTDLLQAMRELTASDFEDNPPALAPYRLDPPRGRIVLHFRGSEKTAALLLGGASQSGQMTFCRPEGSKFVAITPAEQLAKLLQEPSAYWSKQILALPAEAEITQVGLARPEGKVTVERSGQDEFKLSAPVAAPADRQNVEAALEALKEVRAEKIVSLADALPKRFAKAKPIAVELTYRVPAPPPPPASQPATATAPATASAPTTALAPTTTTGPATAPATQPTRYQTHHAGPLLVAKDKTFSYVWQDGAKPVVVGELSGELHDRLAAEMRDRKVMKVQADQALAFKLVADKTSIEFNKEAEKWSYTGDRHVRIDEKKVTDFLSSVDLKAQRFVDYAEKPALARFGLDAAVQTLEVKYKDGKTLRLSISRTGPVGSEDRYAASSEVPGVFILAANDLGKLKKKLADFQK